MKPPRNHYLARTLCFTWALLLLSLSPFSSAKSNQIKLLTNNWTSQIVLAHVTGQLLKKLGYEPIYISSSVSEQWGALAYNAADVQVEVWEGTMADAFKNVVSAGYVIDAGSHSAKTREDWWYPDYVESICPGLPDWKALKKCSTLFSEDGMAGAGIYVAGPWEKPDKARIRALGMNFKVKLVEKGDDLWVELKNAITQKRPIVLFNWTPNWVESRHAGKFIEFPEYHRDCETKPEWGFNPHQLYDCGNPKEGWLKKGVSLKFTKNHPCAFQLIKNINFTNYQISQASAFVDVDGLTHADAANRWLLQNKQAWQNWMPEPCQR